MKPKSSSAIPAAPRYRIGAVAQVTGIATETLRVWERRYQVVTPARTLGGGRLYSDGDVTRLRLIRQLVDRGQAISRIAGLDEEQLRAVYARFDQGAVGGMNLIELRARFLAAAERLDVQGAQQLLGRAALFLGPRVMALELMVPLLQELGERWARGTTRICHEHMSSAIVRTVLGGLIATQPVIEGGRRIVVATPRGELHEFGALLTALLASAARWNVLYLGPDLPAEEICEAARRSGAGAVAISVVHRAGKETEADLRRLVADLPAAVTLLAGGSGAVNSRSLGGRAELFTDLAALDGWFQKRGEA